MRRTTKDATTEHPRPRAPRPGLLTRLGQRLFAAEDQRARERGWEVRSGGRGLSREYRDPRWDARRRLAEETDDRRRSPARAQGGRP